MVKSWAQSQTLCEINKREKLKGRKNLKKKIRPHSIGKGRSSERKTVGWTGTGGSVGILSCTGRRRTRRGAQSRKGRGLAWRAGLQAKVMISPNEGKNTATGGDHRWETDWWRTLRREKVE